MPVLDDLLDADAAAAAPRAQTSQPATASTTGPVDFDSLLESDAAKSSQSPLPPKREQRGVVGEFVHAAAEPFKAMAKAPSLATMSDDEWYDWLIDEAAKEKRTEPAGGIIGKAAQVVGGLAGGVAQFTGATAAAIETGPAAPFVGPAIAFGASGSVESARSAGIRALIEGKPKSEVVRIAQKMAGIGAGVGAGTAVAFGATGLIPKTATALARTVGTGAIGATAGAGGQLVENVAEKAEGLDVNPMEGLLEQAAIMGLVPVVAHARDLYRQARGVAATDPAKAKALEKEATDLLKTEISKEPVKKTEEKPPEVVKPTPEPEVATPEPAVATPEVSTPKPPETPPEAPGGVVTPSDGPKTPPAPQGGAAEAMPEKPVTPAEEVKVTTPEAKNAPTSDDFSKAYSADTWPKIRLPMKVGGKLFTIGSIRGPANDVEASAYELTQVPNETPLTEKHIWTDENRDKGYEGDVVQYKGKKYRVGPKQEFRATEKGKPDAKGIRSDTGQPAQPGSQPEGIKEAGGDDVQQPTPGTSDAPAQAKTEGQKERVLGPWPESQWTYAHLKGLTMGQRADRARYLGMRTKDGMLEVSSKKLADRAKQRFQEMVKESAATPAAERIVSSAYRTAEGKIETGANHPEILQRLGIKGFETRESRNTPDFGFQTDRGRFISREEAGKLATASGQNLEEFDPNEPVHADQIESPTQPGKALGEVSIPESTAKEIGFTFNPTSQVGAIRTEGLSEADAAKLSSLPKLWEFTDKRNDSPTRGLTFYMPENSTREQILKAYQAKLDAETKAPIGETKPTAPAPENEITPAEQKKGFDAKQAKAQKKFLLTEIDKAIEEAPAERAIVEADADKKVIDGNRSFKAEDTKETFEARRAEQFSPLFGKYKIPEESEMPHSTTKSPFEKRMQKLEEEIAKARYQQLPKITIEVPGDGVFEIINDKQALKDFREKAESFPTTAPRAKEPGFSRETPTSAAKVGKLEPDAIRKAARLAASTDPQRKVINNIYSDGKVTVSTDGRRMTIIKGGIGGTESAPIMETPAGKQIAQGKDQPPQKPISTWKVSYTDLEDMAAKHPFFKRTANVAARSREDAIARVKAMFAEPKYGRFAASKAEGAKPDSMFGTPEEEQSVKYPDYRVVVPQEKDLKESMKDLDTGRLFTVARQAQEVTLDKGPDARSIKLYRNKDGSMGVAASSAEIGEYAHNVQEGTKLIVALNPEYFIDAVNSARMVGDEKVTLKWIDDLSPIVIEGKNSKSVIMPMRLSATPTGEGHTIEGARAEAEAAFGPLSDRVSFVHEPENPSGAYTDRNKIVVNTAKVAPGTVEKVLLEEGLHGVWNDPAVQGAWKAFRDGVSEYDIAAERSKRKGLDTTRETLKEEAAISKLLNNPEAPLAKRVWDAIIATLDKLFGVKVPDDRAQLIEAARSFLQAEPGAEGEMRFATPTTGKAPIEQYTEALKGIRGERVPLAERFKDAFDVGARLSTAKDAFGRALSGLKATGDYLKQRVQGIENVDDLKREKGIFSAATETRGWQTKKFVTEAKKAVPRPRFQAAISKWLDIGGDLSKLKQAEAEVPERFKQAYRDAQKLTPDQVKVAEQARAYFESIGQEAVNVGVLEDLLADYIHRFYERRPDLIKKAMAYVQSGVLKTNPDLAKRRVFEFDFEAEKAGFAPVQSFIDRIAQYETSLSKAIASRRLVAKATEMKASDGRPVIDIKGVGIPITDEEGKRTGTLIKPQFNPSKGNQPGTPNFRGDYVTREYPALSKWKWVSNDADGKPVFVQGDVAIHPEHVHRFDALLEPSRLRYGKYGTVFRPALAVSSAFKQTMLDLSGFHQVQISVHAMEHRVNPLNLVKDINFQDANVDGLLKSGLTIGGDYHYQGEGLIGKSLIRQVPLLGPLAESYHNWLFQDFIPRIKVTMAQHALERNRERYKGQLTDEQILFKTAQQANDAFGGQNLVVLERSRTAQDIARLIMLAPDFLESRGRFAASGLAIGGKRFGNEQRTALLLGALTLYTTARILNKLTEDQYHFEPENVFSWVHKGQAYSLRTVQGDILHLLEKPLNFWMHRLNPVFGRTTLEAATGRDEFGRKRSTVEQLTDFVSTAIPISLRTSRERTLFESFANAMGVTDRRWQDTDDAFKLAKKWKADHGVGERGEFIYDPEKDPLRGLKVALSKQDDAGASVEIKKLIQSKSYTLPKLEQYFIRFKTMPFTGSKSNDIKWFQELSDDEKKTVLAARQHKDQIYKLFRNAEGQYRQALATTPNT